eukprot:3767462-Prymnesium_polylepis.1
MSTSSSSRRRLGPVSQPVERASSQCCGARASRRRDGKRARLLNSPFFGHAERTTRTFNPRCCASLRGHLRLQWLH